MTVLNLKKIQKKVWNLCIENNIEIPKIEIGINLPDSTNGGLLKEYTFDYNRFEYTVNYILRLNKKVLGKRNKNILLLVLIHEIAHIKYFNHGKKFSKLCVKMGGIGSKYI